MEYVHYPYTDLRRWGLEHKDLDKLVLFEKDPKKRIATITLNRPEKMNALLLCMWDRISNLIQECESDEDVKVIVLKGSGANFCAGHDVGELGAQHGVLGPNDSPPPQRRRLMTDCNHYWGKRGIDQVLTFCKKSTLALVQGYCYGGGLQLALEADVTIATGDAKFTHPGWRYIGPTTDVWLLTQTIGIKRAKEMMLTGVPIDAKTALDYALVNKVVPNMKKLEEEGAKMAEKMAMLPIDGICMGKVQFEAVLEAMGAGNGFTANYMMHTLQTNIKYAPGEYNLFKSRKRGVKQAIEERKKYYGEK